MSGRSLRAVHDFDQPEAPLEPHRGTCTAGELGDPCSAAQQCDSGYCGTATFAQQKPGVCTRGQAGDPCGTAEQCSSSFCVFYYPEGSAVQECQSGAPGAACQTEDDCLAGACAYDPDRGWGQCE